MNHHPRKITGSQNMSVNYSVIHQAQRNDSIYDFKADFHFHWTFTCAEVFGREGFLEAVGTEGLGG